MDITYSAQFCRHLPHRSWREVVDVEVKRLGGIPRAVGVRPWGESKWLSTYADTGQALARLPRLLSEAQRPMFLDLKSGDDWGDLPSCMSCKRPIQSHHPTDRLELPFDPDNGLHELNGIYHSECAKPYLSLSRAIDMLGKFGST
jgi:hypothetical protein